VETVAKPRLPTVAAVDVVLLRWPVQQARREVLRTEARPRLLLVEDGAPPPVTTDDLEDWIRVPAAEVDLRARVEGLRRRVESREPAVPRLDDDGVLRVGSRWVSLPPVEARLTAAMLERFGAVVSREALGRAGWPDGTPGRNALDVHVLRLRRRLTPVALAIRTVRSRGYLLERRAEAGDEAASDPGQQRVREA
jgi:DNA-binding winged helix-turn-helix (wHTH) protein